MIENAVLCMPEFGVAWAVSASVPMIVLCMACVKPLRKRWTLYGADGRLRMGIVLGATLGCAVLTAVKTVATLMTALGDSPHGWPDISVPTYFWAYVLGAYLGALTLTPTMLALHERATRHATGASVWRSPLFLDVVLWVVPALSGLAWLALSTHGDVIRQVARLAMLLPVLGLALRHGWHGTAIAGMGASIALAATGTVLLEPAMIQCQVILALFLSAALMVGARLPISVGQSSVQTAAP
jgi:glucose-6-phosphate-specific signal transduction histidine kinase